MSWHELLCLSCLKFTELLTSINSWLSPKVGHFSHYFFRFFSAPLCFFLPSGTPISRILDLWVLYHRSSFLSSSFYYWAYLVNGLSILFIFSKNQLLVLLIFAIVFFVSISFISALIFMISFLLLALGFVCSSFSSSFRCKVRLLRFFFFLEVGLYSYKLPS